jgi:hypothetical protein
MFYLFSKGSRPLVILLFPFLYACSSATPENDLAIFKILDESLINANRVISRSNEVLLATLQDRLLDPTTHYKAEIWQPKTTSIQKITDSTISYFEGVKSELNKRIKAGKETDRNIVSLFFKKEGNGINLYKHIKSFSEQVLSTDSLIRREFSSNLNLLSNGRDSFQIRAEEFTETFFTNTTSVAALAMLTQLENRINMAENRLLRFCLEQVPKGDYFHVYSVIIGQSISYVKAGQEIEITAGVGSFSRMGNPKITIDGKEFPIGEYGTANYKFKASKKVGKYILPVKIEYTDEDGKKEMITKEVEYTVMKE